MGNGMTEQGSRDPIWWLELPPVEESTGDIAAEFEAYRAKTGFVPTMMNALAHKPESFLAYRSLAASLLGGENSQLTPIERELIALVVSVENRCDLCVISHASLLRGLGVGQHLVGIIEVNYRRAALDPRMRALADFAVGLTQAAHEFTPATLAPLRAAGLSELAILEGAWIAAFFNMSNRLMSGLGVRSQVEAYEAHRC